MLKSPKKGDPVLTTSGILGTIVSVAEDFSKSWSRWMRTADCE